MSIDLSELDRVAEMCGVKFIPEGRGFTTTELRRHLAAQGAPVSEMTTKRRINSMLEAGQIVVIGKRPGCGGATVYEMVR